MKNEIVQPERFKRYLTNCQGVDNLQLALNILKLYQEWRTQETGKPLAALGITPSLITAALEYVFSYCGANKRIYKCRYCKRMDDFGFCGIAGTSCKFVKVKDNN